MIQQGDVFWLDTGDVKGRALAFRRPHVVIQGNPFNQSQIPTIVVCPITSNINKAHLPGNILLRKGEADLPKDSLVRTSEFQTVDREHLVEKIGTLSLERVEEIIKSIKIVLDMD